MLSRVLLSVLVLSLVTGCAHRHHSHHRRRRRRCHHRHLSPSVPFEFARRPKPDVLALPHPSRTLPSSLLNLGDGMPIPKSAVATWRPGGHEKTESSTRQELGRHLSTTWGDASRRGQLDTTKLDSRLVSSFPLTRVDFVFPPLNSLLRSSLATRSGLLFGLWEA